MGFVLTLQSLSLFLIDVAASCTSAAWLKVSDRQTNVGDGPEPSMGFPAEDWTLVPVKSGVSKHGIIGYASRLVAGSSGEYS